MADPQYPYERDRLDRLISATSVLVEEAKADPETSQEISEAYARLADAIDTIDAMPRFYFHFEWDHGSTPDHCGVALPDLAAALHWAETEARHLGEPEWPLGLDPMSGVITIADEDGNVLAQVVVREFLPPEAPRLRERLL